MLTANGSSGLRRRRAPMLRLRPARLARRSRTSAKASRARARTPMMIQKTIANPLRTRGGAAAQRILLWNRTRSTKSTASHAHRAVNPGNPFREWRRTRRRPSCAGSRRASRTPGAPTMSSCLPQPTTNPLGDRPSTGDRATNPTQVTRAPDRVGTHGSDLISAINLDP